MKLGDLILAEVWEVAGFDPDTGKVLFHLANCNEGQFEYTSDKVEITAGRSARTIAVLSGTTKAQLSITSATFDLNLLSLQVSDDDAIYATNVDVPVKETLVCDATAGTITLSYTPDATSDEPITVLMDDGTALIESDEAGEGKFTVAGKILTLPASFKGATGTVFYVSKASEAVDITINSNSQIQYATIKAEVTFQNQCDGLNYLGYVVIPKAAIDKSFTMAANKAPTDGGSVHNVVFNCATDCHSNKLARLVIYDADDLTTA